MSKAPASQDGDRLLPAIRLRNLARDRPEAVAFVDLDAAAEAVATLTWGEVDRAAQVVASYLRDRVDVGGRVALAFAAGGGFAQALFGCFYAGLVAVPCAPPLRARGGARALGVLQDSGAQLMLTSEALAEPVGRALAAAEGSPRLVTLETVLADAADAKVTPLHRPGRDEVAVLQYTSGSTSQPRGVAITHGNVAANLGMLVDLAAAGRQSAFLTWLPLYHDMGLITGYLMPLAAGATSYLISPAAFARRPANWLEAASRYGATHTAAPNFAYELCANRIPQDDVAGLDLSALHWALNAAEMIRRGTNDAFLERFAANGFQKSALAQYYGLAEATVCVTGHRAGRGPRYLPVSGTALERGRVAEAAADAPDLRWVAGVGSPGEESAVAIVDPQTAKPVADGRVGEIWATGPSMALGYWEKPEATAETFGFALPGDERRWFRTGDLGFCRDGELYITGRLKELIIVGGRNVYPVDIEATVQDLDPRLVRDRGAAFALEQEGTEAVAIVQELRREGPVEPEELLRQAAQAVAETHEVEVAAVSLIRQGTLPLTSSGKVQRGEARRRLLNNELKENAGFSRTADRVPAAPVDPAGVVPVLCAVLGEELGIAAASIDPNEALSRFGFGSMTAARPAERGGTHFGLRIEPTQFYDYTTVAAVADWIVERLNPVTAAPAEPATAEGGAAPAAASGEEPDGAIAIIGMACRMPGAADLETFWSRLLEGYDGIGEPPPARRELREQLSASPDVPARAGYVDEVELFDPAFFRMGKREADLLDPQHRLLLETAWHGLEHAGLRAEALRGARVGTFVGISTADYGELLAGTEVGAEAHYPTGNAHNMAPNRLAYFFDWRGPSLGVDTACSSSLVAVHMAMQSLRAGESELALAGGVNVILAARLTRAFHAAGMLSADCRCKTFDAAADGYVRGEGCGVVVLKPLAAAQRDGDRVIAVLRGSAVNQDGLSNGITAPNGQAQQAAIRAALDDAGLAREMLGYIECHGTGTELGDPIEAKALAAVLGPPGDRPRPLLGAVKASIAHLEAAAGIAGLIKAALVVSRGEVPPNANFATLNPLLEPTVARLEPVQTRRAWPAERGRRIAGVSSFGFGGSNAHVVLEAPAGTADTTAAGDDDGPPAELLCLSAGSEAALRQLAEDWRDRMAARPEVPAATWAENAARRRGQLAWRLAVVGATTAELEAALSAWLAGRTTAAAHGRAPKQRPARIGIAFSDEAGAGPGAKTDTSAIAAPLAAATLAELGVESEDLAGPALRLASALVLGRAWQAWGLRPAAVAGTGVGAWAASVVAGGTPPQAALQAVVEAGHNAPSDPLIAAPASDSVVDLLPATSDPGDALRLHGCDYVVELPATIEPADMLSGLARAWVVNAGIEPAHGYAGRRAPFIDLPPMRFERRLCWYDAPTDESGWLDATWQSLGAVRAPLESLGSALRPLAALGAVGGAFAGAPARPGPAEVQEQLTSLVAELLGQDPAALDPHERFVEMGADSIVLATALRRVEERFGARLTVRQLFESTPDISSLAAYLAAQAETDAPPRPAPPEAATPGPGDDLQRLFRETEATMRTLQSQQNELRRRLEDGTPPKPAAEPPDRTAAEPALPPWRSAPEPEQTAERRDALRSIIGRYTAKTGGSKRLAAAYRPRLSDNRASAGFRFSTKEMVYPLVGERAEGAYLWDVDGNRYVDITMGFGACLFGHAPDFVQRALREELDRGWSLGPQSRLAGEAAELVCDLTGADRVAFCSTGTEAVMTALRLARTVTGRRRIALFEGAYHGHADGVLAAAGAQGTVPMAPGVSESAVADVLVLPYGEPQALEVLRAEADKLAAILVEPVQSRRPHLQPTEFLRALRQIADASGAVLLFDEMITGFRISAGGAQAHFGVTADLVTYGKILGGGLPIGAVAGRAGLLDALDGGQWTYGDASYPAAETTFFAGTYNKHPLALAASCAVLRRIAETQATLYPTLNARTAALQERVERLCTAAGSDLRLSRFGSLFRFAHADNADAFLYALRARGIFLWEGRNCFLSTVHGEEEVAAIEAAVAGALEDASTGPARQSTPSPPATEVVPLSRGQRQLCLLGELRPGAAIAYHESVVLELPTGLDAATLGRAFAAVTARHAALRTILEPEAGLQRVLPQDDAGGALEVVALDAGEAEEAAHVAAVAQPFAAGAPAVRLRLLQRSDGSALLVLVAHHAVADGRSLAIVVHDLATALAAAGPDEPREPVLPAAPSFADYLAAQADRAEARRANLAAWRALLSDPAALALALPGDHVRPEVARHDGGAVAMDLPLDVMSAISSGSRRFGVTPFMVFLAAYLLLLHRLSGQEVFVVGVPSDGRITDADNDVVGDCAQLLPVISRLQPDDTIAAFVVRLRDTLLDAYDRQDFDFAELLESLDLPFDRSRPPLIAAAFNLDQTDPLPAAFGAGASLQQAPTRHVKLDLWLNLTRVGEATSLRLEYASELFERATVARWRDLYVQLLRVLADQAPCRPHDLPLWQATRRTAREPAAALPAANVADWIAAVAATAGERPAVDSPSGPLTYAQLSERVEQVAQGLRAHGVGRETPVGICMEPGADMPVALLAVLRAGGCYVPLEPDQPRRRLAAMAAGAGCALLLTDTACAALAADIGPTPLTVAELATTGADAPQVGLDGPDSSQLAYVMHTSGSTGTPKAVAVTHSALCTFLAEMASRPGLGAADRLLSVTPLGFDIAALELFLPLVTGGRVAILEQGKRGDPQALVEALEAFGATAMQATPATWRMLTDHGWRPPAGFKMLCGGEALPPALAARLTETGADLWNLYGPTDTTIWSSRARIDGAAGVHLGDPIGGTSLHLLDGLLDPVPDGAVGEVAIAGDGLARGYLGQPALTAERFRPDPHAGAAGARLYLTGDLTRVGADGRLRYLGRGDDQVKLRGHRIELGEIAAALEGERGVRQAAAVLNTRVTRRTELEAFFVPEAAGPPSVEALRAGLAERLPSYMLPQRFHRIDALPLTTNGKLDRAALLAQAADATRGASHHAPTEGALESAIAQIWQDVLELPDVGAEQGFFELGGTSLDLARAHDRIQARLNRRFPLALCVAYPTVRTLAAQLTDDGQSVASPALAKAYSRAERRRAALQTLTRRQADTPAADVSV